MSRTREPDAGAKGGGGGNGASCNGTRFAAVGAAECAAPVRVPPDVRILGAGGKGGKPDLAAGVSPVGRARCCCCRGCFLGAANDGRAWSRLGASSGSRVGERESSNEDREYSLSSGDRAREGFCRCWPRCGTGAPPPPGTEEAAPAAAGDGRGTLGRAGVGSGGPGGSPATRSDVSASVGDIMAASCCRFRCTSSSRRLTFVAAAT